VSLVVKKSELNKSLKCYSREIFGVAKKINIAVWTWLVGGTLINHIESAAAIEKRKDIKLNVLLLPILKKVLLNKKWN
jgi:aspartokinase/homoserine dehydrogenase 1